MERAPLIAHTDAVVIPGPERHCFEFGSLRGIYIFECYRPKAGLEDKYAPIFKRISELTNKFVAGMMLTGQEIVDLAYCKRMHAELTELAWGAQAENTVCTVGKNLALDTFLAGSAYSATGPFLGLISSVSFSATAAADTMASHAGWLEAGTTNAPQWTTPAAGARHTTSGGWAAAASGVKALAAAKSYSISSAGTVKGAFLVYGPGAVATAMDTNGTLMSAGVFSGGDKLVANLDTLNVSYSLAF